MALGESFTMDIESARTDFETAVNNTQNSMALRYLTAVVDDLYERINKLEVAVLESTAPKAKAASKSKSTKKDESQD